MTQPLTKPQIEYAKVADWIRIGLTDDEILTMGGLPKDYTIDTSSLIELIRSHEEILAAE